MSVSEFRPLTFVTVVFESEFALLRLQAASMSAHLPPQMVDEIIVVDNSAAGMPGTETRELLSSYGVHKGSVRLVRPASIAAVPSTTGWRSQQVYKLCIADQLKTDHYVVLDAKNHFIGQATPDAFMTLDGRPRVNAYDYRKHPLRGELERVLTYLGLEPGSHVDEFTATVTPFVFITSHVRELIRAIETRSGRPFAEEFIARGLTEFFLYSGWLIATGHDLHETLHVQQQPCAAVWPSPSISQSLDAAIAKARATPLPVFSVHRKVLAAMDVGDRRVLAGFWAERGLFGEADEAARFLAQFQARRARPPLRVRLTEAPTKVSIRLRRELAKHRR